MVWIATHFFFLNSVNELDIKLHKHVLYNYYAQLVLVHHLTLDAENSMQGVHDCMLLNQYCPTETTVYNRVSAGFMKEKDFLRQLKKK